MVVPPVLNSLAEEISAKVNVVRPLSYLSSVYREEKSSDIILIYKEGQNITTSNVSITNETLAKDDSCDFELEGNPLEHPFEDIDADTSVVCDKQSFEAWPKCEEKFLPIPLNDARYFAYRFATLEKDLSPEDIPDVWVLTKSKDADSVTGDKANCSVVLGLRRPPVGIERPACFRRSDVKAQGLTGMDGPLMDLTLMKQQHLKLCTTNMNLQSEVMCTYQLSGQRVHDEDISRPLSVLGSVSLEVKWRQPQLRPPVHEATATMVIQAAVSDKETRACPLWRQLWTLEKLAGVLTTAWREKKNIVKLPTYSSTLDHSISEGPEKVSVVDRLKTLFKGGAATFSNARDGSTVLPRMSVNPRHTIMKNMEDSFQPSPSRKSVEDALSTRRMDTDAADDLWTILSDCETYKELSDALDMVYREIKQGRWKPFIRHKHQSRTSYLLQTLYNEEIRHCPDLTVFDGSGVLYAAESLFELGLEKLSLDYIHIFVESGLATRDEIAPPPFPRKDLGVSQDAWLASCNNFLKWIARMHAAVEVVLLAEDALKGASSTQPLQLVASQALSYFQGDNSPVLTAGDVCSPAGCNLSLRATIYCHQIDFLLSQKFDCWQLTLSSSSANRQVDSVFHRSRYPIFPPQLVPSQAELEVQDEEALPYFCSLFTTIMDRC